ncbi:MAG: UbiA family prenyltransferase [Thermoplasmatales archaeon]|nr:MAG: UbiA family prenyltransferase [Thermoplasmatales archaeon]
MNLKNKVLEYFRLMRPQGAAQTAIILLLGSLIMGQRDLSLLFIIFLIGFLGHIHGFVLNDYADIEVDKKSYDLEKKPLVRGEIPKSHALAIVIITACAGYALTIAFFFSIFTLLLLTIVVILSGIYNFYGKKILGSEFIISAGLAVFCLFGASTALMDFTNIIYIVSLIFFVEGVFIHVVEGGLKDVDHDYLAKAKTLPTIMGVRVKNEKLLLTNTYTIFAYLIKISYFLLIILLGFQPEINLWFSDQYILLTVVVILMILIVVAFYKFLYIKTFDRSKMKKIYAALNATTLSLLFIMLLPIIELEFILFLILLPIIWYTGFNYILYGKPLQPTV